jgi:ornithine cyclodeaminase
VPRYLTDAEFRSLMAIPDAIAAVEACFKARAAGALGAFVRRIMPVGPAGLALTPGGSLDLEAMGLRAYPTGTPVKDQLTAVWHPATGDLLGMVAGTSLGAYRTGAIGAIAVRERADDDAHTLALIGAGLQAATQLPAICAVRPIREVRVFRRDRAALDAFVKSHAGLANAAGLAVSLTAAASPREAVRGAQIVVLSTTSRTPVIEAAWLEAGTHVNVLGPKLKDGAEIGLDLVERAEVLFSDVPEMALESPDSLLAGTRHRERLQDLARLMTLEWSRPDGGLSVFWSNGLGGTEVAVAAEALRRAERAGVGVMLAV